MAMWELVEDGCVFDTVEADTVEEALDEGESQCDLSNYGDEPLKTVFVVIAAREVDGEGYDTRVVELEPSEPPCVGGSSHEWTAPHALVGGCSSNPGVMGHGGGVIIEEVCEYCGCGKTTDTWATEPTSGQQGLTSVTYTPHEYDIGATDEDD